MVSFRPVAGDVRADYPKKGPSVTRSVLSAMLLGAACSGGPAQAEPPALAERPDLELLGRIDRPVAVVVLEVGENFHGPEGANLEFISAAHPVMLSSEPMAAAKQSGISPKQFERVVATLGDGSLIVATVSDAATLAQFRTLQFPDGREETVDDRQLIVDGKTGFAGYEPTNRMLAFGRRALIEKTLKPVAHEPDWALRQFQTLAREKPLLALQVDATTFAPRLKAEFPPTHGLAPLFNAQAWRLVCKKTAQGLHVTLSAHFDNAPQAAASVEAARALQNMLVLYFNISAIQMPGMLHEQAQAYPDGPKIARAFGSSLNRISLAFGKNPPQALGGTLAIDCEVETETPAADLLYLLNLIPRAAKPPGQP